ncbi:MAG: recombinase family protein [Dehalococcoidia bacterium]
MQNPSILATLRPSPTPTKLAALITRVSLDEQARNPEGSLVNQIQRLRTFLDYRNSTGTEQWLEAGHYELRGVSGKNAVRSPEFQRLFNNIRAGTVNVVVVTALDRVCRSVADFLSFFEFLTQHGVEFVSLREQFDTSTPQGRFMATLLMAMAQMEREITSLRTSEAMSDRALRGLSNGGRLLGFDLDLQRPGYLIPNPEEVVIVLLAFELYLELGSIKGTAEELNQRGYRTKSYTSRRGKHHPGTKFSISSMQYLLKNVAYIGKKEVLQVGESGEERHLVDAVWPAIVSEEKFYGVQQLLADNGQTRRNGASSVQHVYSLSGLVHCKRCNSRMDGESATGRIGKKYFYYRCSNRDCKLRAAAAEVEEAIIDRLQLLAEDPELLETLTAETNKKLQQGRPKLERQKGVLEKDLKEVKGMADKLLTELVSLEGQPGQALAREKLNNLGQQQLDLEHGLAEVQQELDSLDQEAVDVELVRSALGQVRDLYGALKPYEQKELMQLVLQRAEVNEREITLEVYALTGAELPGKVAAEGAVVRMPPDWLPGLVPQSVALDQFPLRLPSLVLRQRKETRVRTAAGRTATAEAWQSILDDGTVKNRAQLARRLGVTRAGVTRVLGPEFPNN